MLDKSLFNNFCFGALSIFLLGSVPVKAVTPRNPERDFEMVAQDIRNSFEKIKQSYERD